MEWPAHLPLVRGGGVSKFILNFEKKILGCLRMQLSQFSVIIYSI